MLKKKRIKNILVITESFLFGGLETHLAGKIKRLHKLGYNIYLAVGEANLIQCLPKEYCQEIFTGIPFKHGASSKEIISVVNQLKSIISLHNIDIIDAHPFNSTISSFFAANLAELPFVYTMHGPASIMEEFGIFNEWFFKSIVLENSAFINNVSKETFSLVENYLPDEKNVIFRNAIDIERYQESSQHESSIVNCCVVSRLDSAKVVGIKSFLTLVVNSAIKVIDIYGDGPEFTNLKLWIANLAESTPIEINLKGASFELSTIYPKYSFIAGMGRVALEGMASNKPVILVGYDGVKGLLNKRLLLKAAHANFSGRGIKNIDEKAFHVQTEKAIQNILPYQLANWVKRNANEEKIWKSFSKRLQLAVNRPSKLVDDIFNCIRENLSDVPLESDTYIARKLDVLLSSKYYINTYAYQLRLEQRVRHLEEKIF